MLTSCAHPNVVPLVDHAQSTSTTASASDQILFLFPLYRVESLTSLLFGAVCVRVRWCVWG